MGGPQGIMFKKLNGQHPRLCFHLFRNGTDLQLLTTQTPSILRPYPPSSAEVQPPCIREPQSGRSRTASQTAYRPKPRPLPSIGRPRGPEKGRAGVTLSNFIAREEPQGKEGGAR